MDTATVSALRDVMLTQLGLTKVNLTYTPIRTSAKSYVERLAGLEGGSWVLKYTRHPWVDEPGLFSHLRKFGVLTPQTLADVTLRGDDRVNIAMAMAMDDLGPEARRVDQADAAIAAVRLHNAHPPNDLLILDPERLTNLLRYSLAHLEDLQSEGRWLDEGVRRLLQRLAAVAKGRAQDADIPPYGMSHGHLTPTSLLIDKHRQLRVLNLDDACIGPGLLDLAAYLGTANPPDIGGLKNLLAAYVVAGGPDSVHADRAGLPPERWALGWHRIITCDRILELSDLWIPDSRHDAIHIATVIRLLGEAVDLLDA